MSASPVASLEGHEDRVWHCAWSPDGSTLATCGADKVVRVWRCDSGSWECVEVLEDAQSRTVRCAEWSPCGSYVAAASFDSTTVIWQRGKKEGSTHIEWQVVATLEGPESEIKSVAWSADGSMIAICSRDKSVWIFDGPPAANPNGLLAEEEIDLECISVMSGHGGDVKFVTWHPTEALLFSASYDDTIRVWTEGEEDFTTVDFLQGHTNTVWGLAVHPAGNMLASCSQDCTVRLWVRDERGKWIPSTVLEGVHERTIFSIHWSPDGQFLLSCGGDDAIVCHQVSGEAAKTQFTIANAHESDVNCVRWNPKSPGLFASVGDDALVKLWQM